MLQSQIPAQFPIPFAADAGPAYIRTIPEASQIPITPGAASLYDGFPPLTFLPEGAGGIPPAGADFNGILYQISAWSQWQGAGAPVVYDSVFSAAIGGYPKGALLTSAAGGSWWLSTTDNNTTDPDTGGSGWISIQPGKTYAGNPNGHVAGIAGVSGASFPSILWDTTNNLLWICTTTGNAASAVWTQVNGAAGLSVWCGTSTGSGNAQSVTPPASMQSFPTGSAISFIAGFANTGAMTVTVGSFGTFATRKLSSSGIAAFTGGEIAVGDVVSGTFDGTYIQVSNVIPAPITHPTQYLNGSHSVAASNDNNAYVASGGALTLTLASMASTYNGWGILADAQDGNITVTPNAADSIAGQSAGSSYTVAQGTSAFFIGDGISKIAVFFQTAPAGIAPTPVPLTANTNVTAGCYLCDTSAGSFTLTFPASPSDLTIIQIDEYLASWSKNSLIINPNGATINKLSGNFYCNVSGIRDLQFVYKSGNWSSQ